MMMTSAAKTPQRSVLNSQLHNLDPVFILGVAGRENGQVRLGDLTKEGQSTVLQVEECPDRSIEADLNNSSF